MAYWTWGLKVQVLHGIITREPERLIYRKESIVVSLMVPGDSYFPQAFISHLLALNSDHKPLLLRTSPNLDSSPKPFKLESMWTRDPTATDVTAQVWSTQSAQSGNPLFILQNSLKCKKKTKLWNHGINTLLDMSITTLNFLPRILRSSKIFLALTVTFFHEVNA